MLFIKSRLGGKSSGSLNKSRKIARVVPKTSEQSRKREIDMTSSRWRKVGGVTRRCCSEIFHNVPRRAGRRPLLPGLPRQDYGKNVLWQGLSHGVHVTGYSERFFIGKWYLEKSNSQLNLGRNGEENVAIKHWYDSIRRMPHLFVLKKEDHCYGWWNYTLPKL